MKRFLCQLLLTALFLRAPFVVGASSDPSSPSSGGVFVPDAWVPPEVIADLRAKAEKGDAEAQYNLATYYANDGSRADGLATAMAWYRKAADQADPFAQFALGVMYRRGLGVPEDADTGAIWLSKAMNTVASFAKSIIGLKKSGYLHGGIFAA